MYAIVASGGKQVRATPGEYVEVELLPEDIGEQVELDQVLLIVDGDHVTVGQPTVPGAKVVATVALVAQRRKVIFFHYVPKKRQRRKHGHRQWYTRLRVESIEA